MNMAVCELHNMKAYIKSINITAGVYNEYLPYDYVNNDVFVY